MTYEKKQFLFGNLALDPNRQRRVSYYGRVSTEHEAQLEALEKQMQWYEDQTQYHPNWIVVGRYIDEGITGTLAKKRPAFMRMIEDARQGKFDLIVTREVCRFARNTVDTLVLTRELKTYGVEVYFVSDNIWTMDGDGELRLTIMATLAQEESRKISERVRAGQSVSRANGVLYGNGNIIGYDRVNGTYVINPEQAKTIRTVFEMYAQGHGEKAICNALTVRGDKDGQGNVKWSCVKISRILRNATYKGYIGYNKSRTTDFLEKKRVKNLDEDTIVLVKGDFEPIVSEELWDLCKEIRHTRIRQYKLPDGETRRCGCKSPRSVWAQKLRCRCGGNFRRFRWRTNQLTGEQVYGYECYYRKRNPNKRYVEAQGVQAEDLCQAKSIPEWKLELMAKLVFSRLWGDQREAVLLAYEMIRKCKDAPLQASREQAGRLASQLEKLENRLRSYATMRADGEIDKEQFMSLREKAEQERQAILSEQQRIQAAGTQNDDTGPSLEQIRKAMERVVDISGPRIAEELIAEFVETITPVQDYRYRWKLCFEKLRRGFHSDLVHIDSTPILCFTIDFATAKQFRENCGMDSRFRKGQWNDLAVEVYI